MKTVVVVGNPKPSSRTRQAGILLATLFDSADPEVLEVSDLGPGLLGWGDPAVQAAAETVAGADLVVFASPTFKATYSGLLKLFLDQFATAEGLTGVTAVPLMLGAGPSHALVPELLLKPVLVELGATTPAPGLYLRDTTFATDGTAQAYAQRWKPVITATVAAQNSR